MIIAIVTIMIIVKSNYNKALKTHKQNQEIETRELKPFNGIHAKGNIKIIWSQGSPQEVKIEGNKNSLNSIKTIAENGVLNVYAEEEDKKKGIVVMHLTVDTINRFILDKCRMESDSKVSLDNVRIELHSASYLKLKGEANTASIYCNSNSRFSGESFTIHDGYIETENISAAHIGKTNKLNIKAKDSSRVYYSGQPKSINISTSGSGSVMQN